MPENLAKKTKVDSYLEDLMSTHVDGKTQLGRDKTLGEIHEAVRLVYGPLGELFQEVEMWKGDLEDKALACRQSQPIDQQEDPESPELSTVTTMSDLLQQTVTLIGQAIYQITYTRRCGALAATPNAQKYKECEQIVRDAKDTLESERSLLFGTKFAEDMKVGSTQLKNVATHMQVKRDLKKLSQGGKASSSTMSSLKVPFLKALEKQAPTSSQGQSYRGGRGYSSARGNQYRGNSSRGWSNNSFRGGANSNFRGTISYIFSNFRVKTHPWFAQKTFSSFPTSVRDFRRGGPLLPRELEEGDKRPFGSKCSQGVGNSFDKYSYPSQSPREDFILTKGEGSNFKGNCIHDCEGSNSPSEPNPEPVCVKHFLQTQKIREGENYHQPEKVERTHPIQALQNGGAPGSKTSPTQGRLDGQTGSPRCLLEHQDPPELKEIPQIHVGGSAIRILSPGIRSRPSPPNLHEVVEDSYIHFEKTKCSDHHLPGRHVDHGELPPGDILCKGYDNLPFAKPRIHHQPNQIYFDSIAQLRVLRYDGQQRKHDNLITEGESHRAHHLVPRDNGSEDHISEKTSPDGGEALCYDPSHFRGPTSDESVATHPDFIPEEITKLRELGNHRRLGAGGTEVVELESSSFQSSTNNVGTSSSNDLHGRFHDRVGSSPGRGVHYRRSMVSNRKAAPHQCARIDSSRTSIEDIPSRTSGEISPCPSRQHDCSILPDQNGGDKEYSLNLDSQKDLDVPVKGEHLPDSELDPIQIKYKTRSKVKGKPKFKRMALTQKHFSKGNSGVWKPFSRSFCFKDHAPAKALHESVSRPRVHRSECSFPELGGVLSLPVPTFLPDRKVPAEIEVGGHRESYLDCPPMAGPSMVPYVGRTVHSPTDYPSKMAKPLEKPKRRKPSSNGSGKSPLDSFPGHRTALQSKGFSGRAANLMLNARRASSSNTYSSPWRSWQAWCSKRGLDPYNSDVTFMADYIAELFESGYAPRTIGVHRSAISAYHDPVDGMRVGDHPTIRQVLAGVKVLRPSVTRYPVIWDVDKVLCYLKSLGDIQSLSLKLLTLKATMLSALATVQRACEIKLLTLSLMTELKDKLVFFLDDPLKGNRSNDPNNQDPLEIFSFEEDPLLCPVNHLLAYVDRTKALRGKEDQVFIATLKPHGAVTQQTIGTWLKTVLEKTGVDISHFKGHSTRHAASSKAMVKGASVKDIMARGNWSSSSIWQKFYNRKIAVNSAKNFQKALFSQK